MQKESLPNDEDEKQLDDLPADDKQKDPYFKQNIKRVVDGVTMTGQVEDIALDQTSRERLYHIQYEDGSLEHSTRKNMENTSVLSTATTGVNHGPKIGDSSMVPPKKPKKALKYIARLALPLRDKPHISRILVPLTEPGRLGVVWQIAINMFIDGVKHDAKKMVEIGTQQTRGCLYVDRRCLFCL